MVHGITQAEPEAFTMTIILSCFFLLHTPAFGAEPATAVVRSSESADHRIAPSGKATVRFLAGPKHGGAQQAFMAVLELAAGAKVPEHADATEEYIYVLAGGGQITIDGVQHTITTGDAVFMPAKAVVSYTNGEAPSKVLQVFAGPGPESKYDSWTTP